MVPDLPPVHRVAEGDVAIAELFDAAGVAMCPCAPEPKQPLTRHGWLDATTDGGPLVRWRRQGPQAVTGSTTAARVVAVGLYCEFAGADRQGGRSSAGHPVPPTRRAMTKTWRTVMPIRHHRGIARPVRKPRRACPASTSYRCWSTSTRSNSSRSTGRCRGPTPEGRPRWRASTLTRKSTAATNVSGPPGQPPGSTLPTTPTATSRQPSPSRPGGGRAPVSCSVSASPGSDTCRWTRRRLVVIVAAGVGRAHAIGHRTCRPPDTPSIRAKARARQYVRRIER